MDTVLYCSERITDIRYCQFKPIQYTTESKYHPVQVRTVVVQLPYSVIDIAPTEKLFKNVSSERHMLTGEIINQIRFQVQYEDTVLQGYPFASR